MWGSTEGRLRVEIRQVWSRLVRYALVYHPHPKMRPKWGLNWLKETFCCRDVRSKLKLSACKLFDEIVDPAALLDDKTIGLPGLEVLTVYKPEHLGTKMENPIIAVAC